MDFSGVKLTDSFFQQQMKEALEYYLSVSDDDFLWGFRSRCGKADKGKQLDGWYGMGVYHVFGQILGGLAKMYCSTGDIRAKEKAERLFWGWAECMEDDGYALNNPRTRGSDSYYEYEKLLSGLLDCIHYIGLDEAKVYAKRLTMWAMKNLDKNCAMQKDGNTSIAEWHTLSENIYRAYVYTGDEIYKEFGEVWEFPFYWDKFLNLDTFKTDTVHAYSHVNNLSGAAMAYMVKGEEKYLDIIKNAYDLLTTKHIYATGGYGPAEKLYKEDGYLCDAVMERLTEGYGHCEVSCCSYAVFKLCKYLLEFTGDAKYADWMEKILYNVIGAEPIPQPDGRILYYADYNIRGAVKLSNDGRMNPDGLSFEWPCCTGTFIQAVAEYANLCYYIGENTLYISQYLPSVISTTVGDSSLELEINTEYPSEDNIDIRVKKAPKGDVKLAFRKSVWVKAYSIKLNGKAVKATEEKGWLVLENNPSDGDIIRITFEQPLYLAYLDAKHPDTAAFCKGSVTLVGDRQAYFEGDTNNLEAWVKPVEGTTAFVTEPGNIVYYPSKIVKLRPLYELPEKETYYMYYRFK